MNRRLLSAAALVGAVITSSLGYSQVFTGSSFAFRLAGAAIVAAMVVVFAPAMRIRRRMVPVAALLTWFLYVSYVVLGSTMSFGLPTGDTFRELSAGLIDGWPLALDDFLPLASNSPVLVLLASVVFAATAVAIDLIWHTERISLPVLAPIVVLGLSLPLAAPAGGQPWWLILAVAVAILGYVLIRANPTHDLHNARLVGGEIGDATTGPMSTVLLRGAPVVLAAALVGALLAGPLSLGRDDPYDPRSQRDEALTAQPVPNPLSSFKAISGQDPPVAAFRLDFLVDEDEDLVDRIALVVLDAYDGQNWSSNQRFAITDKELALDKALDPEATLVPHRIAIDSLPGPWLPAAVRPERIDAIGASFDEASGMLLGDATEYVVVSRVVNPDALGVDAVAATGDAFRKYRELPEAFSAEMATLADQITAEAFSPSEQLNALTEYFSTDFGYDPDTRSGHALGRIEQLLTDDRVGSAEQYATAYALLARSLGLPTRLVIGYDLSDVVDADNDGALDVTSAAYDVWVEVRFDGGLGWMAIDPTPVDASVEANQPQSPGTTVAQGQTQSAGESASEAGPSEAPNDNVEVGNSLATWILPVLVIGFILLWALIFVLVIVATKARRRIRRRRHTNVAGRVEGAWADARDRLVESGVEVSSTMTMAEIVEAGNLELGSEIVAPLRAMVPDVSQTLYGQHPPAAETASRAWEQADNFSFTLRSSRTVSRRILAKLNPRPLLRR